MAITIEGGVILAADTRTSSGRFVANRAAPKINQMAKNIAICRSGAAADTQAVAAVMQHHLSMHKIEHSSHTPVAVAANLLQSIVYANKDSLSLGMIIAGWDEEDGGKVYAIPMGGTLLQYSLGGWRQQRALIQDNRALDIDMGARKVPYALSGSGSAYITGFVDKNWRAGMTAAEGRAFCLRCVAHAFNRDGSSGGSIRLVTISKEGYRQEFVPHTQTPQGYGELPFTAAAAPVASVAR